MQHKMSTHVSMTVFLTTQYYLTGINGNSFSHKNQKGNKKKRMKRKKSLVNRIYSQKTAQKTKRCRDKELIVIICRPKQNLEIEGGRKQHEEDK